MTEAQWLASNDPWPMFEFVRNKISDRKLRWFAAACCHRLEHLFMDSRIGRANSAISSLAEGLTSEQDCHRVELDARQALNEAREAFFAMEEGAAARLAAYDAVVEGLSVSPTFYMDVAASAVIALVPKSDQEKPPDEAVHQRFAERMLQCSWLRDLTGPLLFREVHCEPAWLDWNGGAVGRLAQVIYEDNVFARLPVLADALEEAGCTDAAILAHCRQPAEHVRGCWVLDLLLGKG
jgi:hypothetical protein